LYVEIDYCRFYKSIVDIMLFSVEHKAILISKTNGLNCFSCANYTFVLYVLICRNIIEQIKKHICLI